VDEQGAISFWGPYPWPQIVYAEMLNVLQRRTWWPRLGICPWCGRFFLRPAETPAGHPLKFDAAICQRRFGVQGPARNTSDVHAQPLSALRSSLTIRFHRDFPANKNPLKSAANISWRPLLNPLQFEG